LDPPDAVAYTAEVGNFNNVIRRRENPRLKGHYTEVYLTGCKLQFPEQARLPYFWDSEMTFAYKLRYSLVTPGGYIYHMALSCEATNLPEHWEGEAFIGSIPDGGELGDLQLEQETLKLLEEVKVANLRKVFIKW